MENNKKFKNLNLLDRINNLKNKGFFKNKNITVEGYGTFLNESKDTFNHYRKKAKLFKEMANNNNTVESISLAYKSFIFYLKTFLSVNKTESTNIIFDLKYLIDHLKYLIILCVKYKKENLTEFFEYGIFILKLNLHKKILINCKLNESIEMKDLKEMKEMKEMKDLKDLKEIKEMKDLKEMKEMKVLKEEMKEILKTLNLQKNLENKNYKIISIDSLENELNELVKNKL